MHWIGEYKFFKDFFFVWEDINFKQRPILLQKYNLFQAKKLKQ